MFTHSFIQSPYARETKRNTYLMCTYTQRKPCKFDVRWGAFYCFVLLSFKLLNEWKRKRNNHIDVYSSKPPTGRKRKRENAKQRLKWWNNNNGNEYEGWLGNDNCVRNMVDWQLNREMWIGDSAHRLKMEMRNFCDFYLNNFGQSLNKHPLVRCSKNNCERARERESLCGCSG